MHIAFETFCNFIETNPLGALVAAFVAMVILQSALSIKADKRR